MCTPIKDKTSHICIVKYLLPSGFIKYLREYYSDMLPWKLEVSQLNSSRILKNSPHSHKNAFRKAFTAHWLVVDLLNDDALDV
jgi:hypothetical protein